MRKAKGRTDCDAGPESYDDARTLTRLKPSDIVTSAPNATTNDVAITALAITPSTQPTMCNPINSRYTGNYLSPTL